MNKARKSTYEKDKVFYKIYNKLEDKEITYDDQKTRIPFYTPFIEQKKHIDRSSALYSINALLQFFYADIADIHFFQSQQLIQSTSYSGLIYSRLKLTFIEKKNEKRSNLARKLELVYQEIESKREENGEKMRLQTDLEFQRNEIKKLNKKCNVDMFSMKVRGGKAFAVEQKIRESKKLLFKSKRLHKAMKRGTVDPRKLIRNVVLNMNKTNSQKYGLPPETIEENALEDKKFQEIYDFHRMVKDSRDAERYERHDIGLDKKSQKVH